MGKRRKEILWIAILFWMVLIFLFSAQNGEESKTVSHGFLYACILWIIPMDVDVQTVEFLELLIRKMAHFTEYAILGMLLFMQIKAYALFQYERYRIILGIAAVSFYAATDEIHQLFVPGRSGQPMDVLIDTLGGMTGIIILYFFLTIRIKMKRKRKENL